MANLNTDIPPAALDAFARLWRSKVEAQKLLIQGHPLKSLAALKPATQAETQISTLARMEAEKQLVEGGE